jgi:hypothetical protein
MILFRVVCVLVLLCVPAASQTGSDRWIDYAAVDYDIFPNITYARANNIELKLDLYLARNRTTPTPTLILFHGGGWVDGQKERNVLYLLPYLALGWSAINVEYRTGHQSPAPAAVEDCRCALRWANYHAKEYSFDGNVRGRTPVTHHRHVTGEHGFRPPMHNPGKRSLEHSNCPGAESGGDC